MTSRPYCPSAQPLYLRSALFLFTREQLVTFADRITCVDRSSSRLRVNTGSCLFEAWLNAVEGTLGAFVVVVAVLEDWSSGTEG